MRTSRGGGVPARGVRLAHIVVIVPLLCAGLLAASSTVTSAANTIGASLTDNPPHPSQSAAHATVTCDPTTSNFTITVTGIGLNDPFVTGSTVWATVGGVTPPTPIGTVINDGDLVQRSNLPLAPGSVCVVGSPIEIYGPDSDPGSLNQGLDMTGPLHALDATPPLVTTPASLRREATGPGGASVTFGAATALDAVDGPRPVTCSKASGATFPLGATTVTCTASDNAGNVGTASFTVVVVDTTPPVLTTPGNLVFRATTLGRFGTPTYDARVNVSASDLVDQTVGVLCSPPPGFAYPYATTTVSCSASDRAGNRTTGSFTVTVHAPGGTDLPLVLPSPTTGAVTGTVALPVSRTPPPVPLGRSVTAYACSTSITVAADITTRGSGGQPAPCTAGSSTDGSHTFTVGALRPDSYNLFAGASSAGGDFTAGPALITVTAGTIVTQNLTVTVPRDQGGIVGKVDVTNVPVLTGFAFSHLYACDAVTQFEPTGLPQATPYSARGSPSCIEGTITPAAVTASRSIETDSTDYTVGPLTRGTKQIYVVYTNAFGTVISSPLAVNVAGGAIVAAPVFTIRFPASSANGGVGGTAALPVVRGVPPVALAGYVSVYACTTAIATLDDARAVVAQPIPRSAGPVTPPCTLGGSTRSLAYLMSSLKPGAYNFFAAAPSPVGEYVAGPAAVTVIAGQVVTHNFVLAYPQRRVGLVGSVSVTNVPLGTHFAFVHVYACNTVVTFDADGTPQIVSHGGGPSAASPCVDGTIDAATATQSGRAVETDSTPFQVGPLPGGPIRIYVVFSNTLGVFVSQALSATPPATGVATVPPLRVPFPTATVGGVQGRVTITGAAAGAQGTEGATLTGDVTAYACSTAITSFPAIDTGAGRASGPAPPCVAASVFDATMTYRVGNLRPGRYNLFVQAPSLVGDFIGGPVAVTVVANTVATHDFALTFAHDQGALFGQAQIANAPAGTNVTFLHVYACNSQVQFSNAGTAPTVAPGPVTRTQGPACVEGTLGRTDVSPGARKGTLTFSVDYQVGPLTPSTTVQLYIVYRTQLGIVESSPQPERVIGGKVGTA